LIGLAPVGKKKKAQTLKTAKKTIDMKLLSGTDSAGNRFQPQMDTDKHRFNCPQITPMNADLFSGTHLRKSASSA
jgi:hypothetical protein